jgi:uncharacterized membrane protein YhaH (DUF805 family)
MKNLFTSTGRIRRVTFWKFWIGFFVYFFILGTLQEKGALPHWADVLTTILMLPLLLWAIIIQIKRWHDLDKSGWWVCINLIPVLGALYTFIMCGLIKGTKGDNKYGSDPLAPSPSPAPL